MPAGCVGGNSGGCLRQTAVLATSSNLVAADSCPITWPALHAGPPSGAFDGNVSVLVGGSLHVGGSAAGAEGTVVTLGDAVFARDVPGPYEVGVTALGSQVSPYAGSDMLASAGTSTPRPAPTSTWARRSAVTSWSAASMAAGQRPGCPRRPGRPGDRRRHRAVPRPGGPARRQVRRVRRPPRHRAGRVTDDAITLTGDGQSSLQVFTVDGAALGAGNRRAGTLAAAARRAAGRDRGREPHRPRRRPRHRLGALAGRGSRSTR